MPNYTRSVRGDVNVILNGMIRDGVITSFETNFSDPASIALCLHIRVLADLGVAPRTRAFDERRRELRDHILRQLKPVAPDVIVSVRGIGANRSPKPAAAPGGITGEQCRAARRLLGMSLERFAPVAGVGFQAIGAFERKETVPRPETLAAIVGALEAAGVEFTDGDEPGVKLVRLPG
jgi:hypothetical protein